VYFALFAFAGLSLFSVLSVFLFVFYAVIFQHNVNGTVY